MCGLHAVSAEFVQTFGAPLPMHRPAISADRLPYLVSEVGRCLILVAGVAQRLPVVCRVCATVDQCNDVVNLRGWRWLILGVTRHTQRRGREVSVPDGLQLPTPDALDQGDTCSRPFPLSGSINTCPRLVVAVHTGEYRLLNTPAVIF